jgi:hypothetical protein
MKTECPACGGTCSLQPSDRYIKCDFCEATLHVELGRDLTKTVCSIQIDPVALNGLLLRALKERELVEKLEIYDVSLQYFPYWKFVSPSITRYSPAGTTLDQVIRDYAVESGEITYFPDGIRDGSTVIDTDIYLESAVNSLPDPADPDWEAVKTGIIYVPFYSVSFRYGDSDCHAYVAAHSGTVRCI